MPIPDFQTLMLPLLREAAGGEVRINDAVDALAGAFHLTDEERSRLLPSGRQTTFANRVHWAKSYLGKAGLVDLTRRAHFRASARGLEVLASPPARIDIRYLNQFADFRRFREIPEGAALVAPGPASGPEAEEAAGLALTPDEVIRSAARRLEDDLAGDLLARVLAGTPAFFEALVVRLLIAMGYGGSVNDLDKALVGRSGDGGVDGVIDQDPLGLDRIYVQAKRYGLDNSVGSPAIREFFGSLDHFKASKGLFVTTSSFSRSARATAETLSKRLVLIDGPQLARLMIRHGIGCRVEETVAIKRLDEEFFDG